MPSTPSGVAFVKAPAISDLASFCAELQSEFAPLHLAHFAPSAECPPGAISTAALLAEATELAQAPPPELVAGYAEAASCIAEDDAVLVPIFDPARSLRAIADYRVTAIGQIPAMFNFEWRLTNLCPTHT